MFLTPIGKLDLSSVSSTLMSGFIRGLGVHEYHSLIGATKLAGMFLTVGWLGSSTLTRPGSEGQLLATKPPPPRKSLRYQGQALLLKPEMWKPSHAPPPSMYRRNASRWAAVCGWSFNQI